jgi:hypothetical protein
MIGLDLLRQLKLAGEAHEDAVALVLDGLIGGDLVAIGTPDWPETVRLTRRRRSEIEAIPRAFWRNATIDQRSKWSWSLGSFSVHDPDVPLGIDPPAYRDVVFQADAFLSRLQASPSVMDASPQPSQSNAGRKRKPEWNDWVAYLVLAANDIDRNEGPEAIISKVAKLMADDGLNEIARTTVQPAAQAIIALMEKKRI